MNKILNVFGQNYVFLPVIHVISETQTIYNASVAMTAGADGIFLISHGEVKYDELIEIGDKLANLDIFVGLNILAGSYGRDVFKSFPNSILGFWEDDVLPFSEELDKSSRQEDFLHFGGVAFKYCTSVFPDRYGEVANLAVQRGVDVVTTSGDKTGSPPTLDKIKAMSKAIGDHALAVASGITAKNVQQFLPYVNAFLVATSIEKEFGWLDFSLTEELASIIHCEKDYK